VPTLPIPSGRSFWEEHLLPAVPEFQSTFEEEVEWFGDVFFSHVMMWALTRFVAVRWKDANPSRAAEHRRLRARKGGREAAAADALAVSNRELVLRILTVLEHALAAGDHDLQETVLVSFLEDLPKYLNADQILKLKQTFTPNLASGMTAVGRFRNQAHFQDDSVPFEYLRWDPVDSAQGSP
jgi:hypothetical protein